MVARRPHLSAFVLADGPLRAFTELGGAPVVAEPGSGLAREYEFLLGRHGLTPGPFVPSRRTFHAVAAGDGDVGLEFLELLPRYESAAAKCGVGVRALPFYEAGLDVYGSGVVAGTRLLESRPEAVAAAVAAVREAVLATRDDPRPGAEAMRAGYKGVDPERAIAGWRTGEALIFFDDDVGLLEPEAWERTSEHHARVHGGPVIPAELGIDASFLPAAPPSQLSRA